MIGLGRRATVRVLIAMIALLLPAGVLAAAVDLRTPATGGRVGEAAGLGLEGVSDVPPASRPIVTTAIPPTSSIPSVPTSVPVTTTAPRRTNMTTATTTAAMSGSTNSTLPALSPPTVPPTTVAPIPRVSSWSADNQGISVRMRMEPSEPVAGQPVTFNVDLAPADSCCIVHLAFGDGLATPLGDNASCTHSVVSGSTTHTYATAGAYKAVLVVGTFPCPVPSPSSGGPPVPGPLSFATINACVVVGTAGAACAP